MIHSVTAGFRDGDRPTVWDGKAAVNYVHVTTSSSYGYDGGWHRWGGKAKS